MNLELFQDCALLVETVIDDIYAKTYTDKAFLKFNTKKSTFTSTREKSN